MTISPNRYGTVNAITVVLNTLEDEAIYNRADSIIPRPYYGQEHEFDEIASGKKFESIIEYKLPELPGWWRGLI